MVDSSMRNDLGGNMHRMRGDIMIDVCECCGNSGSAMCMYCENNIEESVEAMNEKDVVENPSHYTNGDIECIDAIRAALTKEEFRGYCKGNILKYIWRERFKNGDEDIEKAGRYIEFALEE